MMKFGSLMGLAASLALVACKSEAPTQAAAEENGAEAASGYVLAQAEYTPKPGAVMTVMLSNEMNDGSFSLAMQGQAMEGAMNMSDMKKVRVEVLAEDKLKVEVLEAEEKQEMVLDGQVMPQPPVPQPLVGKPFMIVKGEGGWEATAEDGSELPGDMAGQASGLVEKVANPTAAAMYGTEPREPGDSWQVDAAALDFVGDMETATGEVTMTLDKVEEYLGMQCAYLTAEMDVRGAPSEEDAEGMEGEIQLKGTAQVIRSLEYFEDVKVDLSGDMSAEMSTPAGKMTMSGPMKMDLVIEVE